MLTATQQAAAQLKWLSACAQEPQQAPAEGKAYAHAHSSSSKPRHSKCPARMRTETAAGPSTGKGLCACAQEHSRPQHIKGPMPMLTDTAAGPSTVKGHMHMRTGTVPAVTTCLRKKSRMRMRTVAQQAPGQKSPCVHAHRYHSRPQHECTVSPAEVGCRVPV